MYTHTHTQRQTETHTDNRQATSLGVRTPGPSDSSRLGCTTLLSRSPAVGGQLVGSSERLSPSIRDPYTTEEEVRVWRPLGRVPKGRALFVTNLTEL